MAKAAWFVISLNRLYSIRGKPRNCGVFCYTVCAVPTPFTNALLPAQRESQVAFRLAFAYTGLV